MKDLCDRIYGCLLGVAIGDALGMPTSFLPPEEIRRIYVKVTGFESPIPNHIYHAGYKPGQVTDDTEQSLFIMKALLEGKSADSAIISKYLLKWFEKAGGVDSDAVGPSSKAALVRIAQGEDLESAGHRGDTNGAAMRISPVGILHGGNQSSFESIVKDVYEVSLPTHGSDLAISGASALACGIAAALRSHSLEDIIAATIEGARIGRQYGFPVIGPSVVRRIQLGVKIVDSTPDLEAAAGEIYQVIGAGVAIAESVPTAISLFYASKGDPKTAMLAAVNMGGDTDTVASMAGALAGAYVGSRGFPSEWVERIEEVNQLELMKRAEELYAASEWWCK